MKINKKAVALPVLAIAVCGRGPAAAWAGESSAVAPVGGAVSSELAQTPLLAPSLFPEMGPTLEANPNPASFDLGPWIGRVYATGVLSGLGFWQSNRVLGNSAGYADISNGMVFVQNAAGPVQFVAQAGVYSIPALGEPYTRASDLNGMLWGPLPQAYVKFAPNDALSVLIGRLPSLLGSEWDFTFQNDNIERGLLWDQENSVNQGIQVNYTIGPVDLSVSVNDGFFSSNFDWLTGSATYAINSDNWLTFSAGGNFGSNSVNTFRTPIAQNNSAIYDLVYDSAWGPWTLAPYVQYTHVPNNSALRSAGFTHDASTLGVAVNVAYSFNDNWKLGARGEYISASGSLGDGAPDLLTGGPGANSWSITLTPSYQYKIFFARAEFSYVGLNSTTPGFAFGKGGTSTSQVRALFETGFIF
ncbi:MAG TPA: outer membrane beta-barrel protein [Stellaceae bacterium]|nr:outer membrane beta-barrel protein [Stellaceae bacterium]